MEISELYEMQKVLDARIIAEKGLEGQNLLPNTILALQVEIGEMANEWRGFKHWSKSQNPRVVYRGGCKQCDYWEKLDGDRRSLRPDGSECDCYNGSKQVDTVLEEYVDCLHFFLSIANQLSLPEDDLYLPEPDQGLKGETTVVFTELLHAVARINAESYAPKPSATKTQRFRMAFYIFFALGEERLGFTWEQIYQAYLDKNKVNHERQENGY